MTEDRKIVPGRIEGFLSGCPFCAAQRIGIPAIGSRFRIILGTHIGALGTVFEWPKNMPCIPDEFLAHIDHEPPEWQTRVSIRTQMIQVFPFAPTPEWAPPLCMSDAGEIDQAMVHFCERSFEKGKWKIHWDSLNEVVRTIWYKRLPLEANELWLILKAHGAPKRSELEVVEFYERGRNLLVHSCGRKPIKKKRVGPLLI